MGWVFQQQAPEHVCVIPGVISLLNDNRGPYLYNGSRSYNDLWRCDECQFLWRLRLACDMCEFYVKPNHAGFYGRPSHKGPHMRGLEWRPAPLWVRFVHRNR